MSRVRVVLDTPEGQRQLAPGTYVMGRADDCAVVIRSSRASRRHAELIVTDAGATLEDLGSANGTYVNGAILTKRHQLSDGDFIVIGDLGLELVFKTGDDEPPKRGPLMSDPGADRADRHPSTTRVNAIEVLVAVADRAFDSEQPEQAERVLERWLNKALDDARAGKALSPESRKMALEYSLRIGVGLRAKRWVDYTFELLTALRQPMTPELAKAIANAIAVVRPTPPAIAGYEQALAAVPQSPEVDWTLAQLARWRSVLGGG
jgi:pSer/pThr/pTyr-binding forkhead associated (FHA) protein